MITDKRLLNTYEHLPSGWFIDVRMYGYTKNNEPVYAGYVNNRMTINDLKYSRLCDQHIYDPDPVNLLTRLAAWIAWCNDCARQQLPIQGGASVEAYRAMLDTVHPDYAKTERYKIWQYVSE